MRASVAYMSSRPNGDGTPRDGLAFERLCAGILSSGGWNVRLTAASGDQGVDVIARKRGVTAAIQCKDWSGPVGNGAVQEALAGKHYIGASHAAVVTRSSYTKAAEALAARCGVKLLHPAHLHRADRVFGVPDDGSFKRQFEAYAAADQAERASDARAVAWGKAAYRFYKPVRNGLRHFFTLARRSTAKK